MVSKVLAVICIQAVLFQCAFSQPISVVNGCGCQNALNYLGALESQVLTTPTTIIQDSTVANNLANALQLLIVSNLLSNTLPFGAPVYNTPLATPAFSAPAFSTPAFSTPAFSAPVIDYITPQLPSCGCGQQFSYIL